MKKYDFLPATAQWRAHPPLKRAVEGSPSFLQDFCKNAQWRAKKLRERGSSTALPTEKGGGVSQLARVLSVSARRFVPIRPTPCRHPVGFGASFRADSADTLPTPKTRHKKARFLNRGIGFSYRKVSRALNLRLIPLSNTRVDVRSVLLGLARRSCIVPLTSDRRHIVHYT